MDHNKRRPEFLYEEEGIYYYRNSRGDLFTSRKKLHVSDPVEETMDEIETRAMKVVASKPVNDRPSKSKGREKEGTTDEEMSRLVDSFSMAMAGDKNTNAPAAHVAEAFKEALTNLTDRDVTAEDIDIETQKLAMKLEQAGIIFQVANNSALQKKVLANSEKKLLTELEVGTQRQTQRLQEATYDASQDALENAGLRKGSPMWLIRIAKFTSGFWGVIIVLLSFFTVTPVVMLSKSLGVQIKNSPLKWILTMILYLGLAFAVYLLIAVNLETPLWPFKETTEAVVNVIK